MSKKKLTPEIVEQYRMVQRKIDAQRSAGVSNDDFLRASNIRVVVDPEVEKYFDEVVEMLNGTNEINYTKRRIKNDKDIADLRSDLGRFGFHAGCVFAADNYGDYGFIGFFLLQRNANANRIIHFTFSCRIMNMGIEQYIYEMLGRPEIEIANPVTYGLQTHAKIDWINGEGEANKEGGASQQKLVLLGGCDLLQLSSYCSMNRQEFVSKVKDGVRVRYDNPAFILNDRETLKASAAIQKVPFWTYEDAANFDEAVKSAQLVLVSLWAGAQGSYFRTSDQVLLHMNKRIYKQIKRTKPGWLRKCTEKLDLDLPDHLKLITDGLDRLDELCRPETRVFVLGYHTFDNVTGKLLELRTKYNAACRDYCVSHDPKFAFVDVNDVVPRETLLDPAHFSRLGYFALAKHIMQVASRSGQAETLYAA